MIFEIRIDMSNERVSDEALAELVGYLKAWDTRFSVRAKGKRAHRLGANAPVTVLPISVRGQQILRNQEIKTVAELSACTESDLHKWRCCGPCTIREIKQALAAYGHQLAGVTK